MNGGILLGLTVEDASAYVARASELAVRVMPPLLSGIFTVDDGTLFRDLYLLHESEGIRIEPSAAAGFGGPRMLQGTAEGLASTNRE
jgi:D-serine dehydratase